MVDETRATIWRAAIVAALMAALVGFATFELSPALLSFVIAFFIFASYEAMYPEPRRKQNDHLTEDA
jgi:hypothetical protein